MQESRPKYGHNTYTDYLNRDDDIRFELIEGEVYMMTAPSRAHQEILIEITGQFRDYLKGEVSKVLIAPFAVRLNAEQGDDTVLEPDLLVVCDMEKLDDKSCVGAPDLVLEILSPSTLSRDKVYKLNQYLMAGVREYWIVDPDGKNVAVHILDNGKYVIYAYSDEATINVHVLEGCTISLPDVFAAI